MYTTNHLIVAPGAAVASWREGVSELTIDWEQVAEMRNQLVAGPWLPSQQTQGLDGIDLSANYGVVGLQGVDKPFAKSAQITPYFWAEALGMQGSGEDTHNIAGIMTGRTELGDIPALDFLIDSWREIQLGH
jgi:hypothetical protein